MFNITYLKEPSKELVSNTDIKQIHLSTKDCIY